MVARLTKYSLLLCLFKFLLSCNYQALGKPVQKLPKDKIGIDSSLHNEITPLIEAWGKPNTEGISHQLILAQRKNNQPTITTKTTSLPLIIWFRNQSQEVKTVRSIYPFFTPHGKLRVLNSDNQNIIKCACYKKHRYEEIELQPGEMRGFTTDAFQQWCCKLAQDSLKVGDYRLEYGTAKPVLFKVINSRF